MDEVITKLNDALAEAESAAEAAVNYEESQKGDEQESTIRIGVEGRISGRL